jgi:primosomal protein N' (replication factor Y)
VNLRNKPAHGVVLELTEQKPDYPTKPVEAVVRKAVLAAWQVALLLWICQYYAAHLGLTLRLFAPERVLAERPAKRTSKLPEIQAGKTQTHTLNPAQAKALAALWKSDKPCLLHGVTGSGKTEVYLQAIQKTLVAGKSALMLVPEIALTPQLTGYLAAAIGSEKIAVVHSNLAEGVRLAAWERIKSGEVRLVIGSRSALYAPVVDLGLVILDEEHEWTYKSDTNPRYHARTVALELARLTGSRLLLGSATPSLESYAAAKAGQLTYLELPERATGGTLPTVQIVNLTDELKKKNFSVFSEALATAIDARLARHEQVVLLVNKRGYATAVTCRDCGTAQSCPHCAVPLTYHRTGEKMICHYCGHLEQPLQACASCGSVRLKPLGTGTQKIEQELREHWPTARIARMDRDTTSTRDAHTDLYQALKNHEIDILLGTQMVAKGLDLPGVTLAGVLLADHGLHLPDFRAGERTAALLMQVAGRSGRHAPGEVIVQTYSPTHPALRAVATGDWTGWAESELLLRTKYAYPPATHMVKWIVSDKSDAKAYRLAAALLAEVKAQNSGKAELAPALVARQGDKYHWHVIWRGADPRRVLTAVATPDSTQVDVDPLQVV